LPLLQLGKRRKISLSRQAKYFTKKKR